MSKWSEIYRRQIEQASSLNAFIDGKIFYKKKLIEKITQHAPPNGSVIEVGCGSGIICSYLSKLGFDVFGVDNDRDMIGLAQDLNHKASGNATFIHGEINCAPELLARSFDVIFSNGVMEHYDDAQIIEFLGQQSKMSGTIIFSVPSDRYSPKDAIFGNERFMGHTKWSELIARSGFRLHEVFGFDENGKSYDDFDRTLSPQYMGFVLKEKT